jgi:hypothetical protein
VLAFLLDERIDLRQAFFDGNARVSPGNTVAERIESTAHSPDPRKQFSIYQHSHRFAGLPSLLMTMLSLW